MQDQYKVSGSSFNHEPVLSNEIIENIKNIPTQLINNGILIDATIGGGGHSSLFLEKHPNWKVIGIDQDPYAISAASSKLCKFSNQVEMHSTNFAEFTPQKKASIVIADLGISSPQLDTANRGFSFQLDGPLDMRMNPTQGKTAAQIIEQLNEPDLADLIYKYGEERRSRKIAHRIKTDLKKNGPYKGTHALAYAIAGCFPPKYRYGKIHPATRSFQALRIAVNNELRALDQLLEKSPEWILSGGLMIIVSFHSLEDRRVKHAFLNDERLERITKKPITACQKEIASNPRSRSAKLRIAQRK